MMIGEQFVSGIINGVTEVDDGLINTILEPVFNNIDESSITQYGDDVNKIVTDQIVKSLDITGSTAVDEVSSMVSGVLTDAFASASPDADITDVIDQYSMGLITSAQAIKISQDQHNLQADIYDKEYEALANLNAEGLTYDQLLQKIEEHSDGITGPIVETYSALQEKSEQLNEVLVQTSEIVLDNTEVTQEYKDSLVELGISEDEIAECFDATNSLVVTNAKQLNKLVKNAKKNTAQNVQLAKSQARLQYRKLYKEMDLLVDANGNVADGNMDVVRTLYAEMNALEKTIARYSMLEAQLLGNANAYEKFQEAQEIDSNTDYMGGAEDMVLALGEAFNTAELGTETAQAAIAGLVPESVYADLDTVDEKMSAIYKYFKDGKISQYFDLEFDDDGNIESAEMKLANLENFINDGLSANVFAGTDWEHFELNQTWLDSLPENADVLQEFADQMNVTKEVAFAFIKSFKDHDIEWLNGDYGTFFDQMLAGTNEGKIQLYTEQLADLTMQHAELAAEKQELIKLHEAEQIGEDEYQQKIEEINKKQEELNKSLTDYNQKLSEAQNLSKQSIFGVGAEETQFAGQVDYQIKTGVEIEATDNLDSLDNWIERNEKVKQLYAEQEEAQKNYTTALNEYQKAVNDNGGKPLADDHETAKALKTAEQGYMDVTSALSEAINKRDEFAEPTVLEIEIALDELDQKIESQRGEMERYLSLYDMDKNGHYSLNLEKNTTEMTAEEKSIYETLVQEYQEMSPEDQAKVQYYVDLLNSRTTLTSYLDADSTEVTLETLSDKIQEIIDLLEGMKISLDPESVQAFSAQLGELCRPRNIVANIRSFVSGLTGGNADVDGTAHITGTAHATGTAHKTGDWGIPTNEKDSLVGELGEELIVNPYTGRYYTVGTNGAEMVDIPRGSIIFNHKQTEELLKNGHISSRGKAYAEGNAHVTIFSDGASKTQTTLSSSASDLSNAASDLSDAADEFNEVFDWIEVRLEELDETLGLLEAKLENATYRDDKNKIIDQMIDTNNSKLENLEAGYKEYADYAAKLLTEIPEKYRDAAQNGAIAIEKFVGDADEATLEAIESYREWAQKSADLKQQAEELITTIRDLAVQKFDNAYEHGDMRASIQEAQTEKLQNVVDYDEEMGLISSPAYYKAMIENSKTTIKYLTSARDAMQKELDDAVASGEVVRGSAAWYEMVEQLYEVDGEIDEATLSIEEFQNAINDIYWDNFDELINRLGYISDDTKNLIDLFEKSGDLFTNPEGRTYEGGTTEYWTADDVQWTDTGLASLGLYAQQMEMAEYTAQQYANAIKDLKKDYADGKYSESEYLEKLNELTSAQHDSIEAYYDSRDAIIDLNKERIESVKDGIKKEIDAYSELIEKKKEELDVEKDLYDWQKSTAEQQKTIAEIKRKLAALAFDNSAAAIAERKKLEAELAEAEAEREEMYYERSIENQKDALDAELEDFTTEKEAEIEMWDKYLENVEQIIIDSLGIVQTNATEIGATLTDAAEEYSLTISDAVLSPWQDGALAVSDYQTAFNTAMSSTTDQLEIIGNQWQNVIDKMLQASKITLDNINAENAGYTSATYTPPAAPTNPTPSTTENTAKPALTQGSYVEVKPGAKWYSDSYGGGAWGYASSGTIKYINISGSHAYNIDGLGWIKKTDIKGYAKGTTSLKQSGIINVDELGEELILGAHNGRLTYAEKGTGIMPADITSNLMSWGALDPQEMLDRNRPQIAPSKSVINNSMEISVDASVGTLIHVDRLDGNNLDEITKVVDKAWDKKMQGLNSAIKKFSR